MLESFDYRTLFAKSIGLTDEWQVSRVIFLEEENSVHIYVTARQALHYPCPICGRQSPRYDAEETERVWRHADVALFPCYVHSQRPRVNCPEHGIHVIKAPWAHGPHARFTLGFEGYAMLLVQATTMKEASRLLRISRGAMVRIASYWVGRAINEDDLQDVHILSIDETSFRRGQSYVTVIGSPEQKRVIGVEPDRKLVSVENFSYDFESRGGNCNQVEFVSIDLSPTYQAATQLCFPQATIVFDHFHVKKLMLEGMDEVRRAEQGRSFSRSYQAGKKLLMIPTTKASQTQQLRVQQLSRQYPKTGRAYRMVQAFDEFYRCQTEVDAKKQLKKLTSWMMHSRLQPMKAVARSLRSHEKEILAFFRQRLTNAFAEGLNSLIQAAKRKARGFHTFEGFKVAIFLVAGKLDLACPHPFTSSTLHGNRT